MLCSLPGIIETKAQGDLSSYIPRSGSDSYLKGALFVKLAQLAIALYVDFARQQDGHASSMQVFIKQPKLLHSSS